METLNAAELLSALGHESRLAVFRLLVEAGAAGINASAADMARWMLMLLGATGLGFAGTGLR